MYANNFDKNKLSYHSTQRIIAFSILSHHRCNREESSRSKITWVFRSKFKRIHEHLSSCQDAMRYFLISDCCTKNFLFDTRKEQIQKFYLYSWYMKLIHYYIYPHIYSSTRLLNDFTFSFPSIWNTIFPHLLYHTHVCFVFEDNLNGDCAKLHLFSDSNLIII